MVLKTTSQGAPHETSDPPADPFLVRCGRSRGAAAGMDCDTRHYLERQCQRCCRAILLADGAQIACGPALPEVAATRHGAETVRRCWRGTPSHATGNRKAVRPAGGSDDARALHAAHGA